MIVHGFAPLSRRVASPSPFCLKLETWLRLAGLPYEAKGDFNPFSAPRGKAPYVTLDDGRVMSDSALIIATLSAEHGIDLDAHLTADQRAEHVLVRRTLEDHLYFCILWERWVRAEGFEILKGSYFGHMPVPARWLVPHVARRNVRKSAHLQGVSRLPEQAIWDAGLEDLRAVAHALGDSDFFGGNQPCLMDCVAYGFIANVLWGPFTGPFQEETTAMENLVAWAERMAARTFDRT